MMRFLGEPAPTFTHKLGPSQRQRDRDRIRARMIEMREAMGLPNL